MTKFCSTMHEFAVCQSLLEQIDIVAKRHAALSVEHVRITIGPLSGVVPELLAKAFELKKLGTIAAGAGLALDIEPLVVRCFECESDSHVPLTNLCCDRCGNWQIKVISGDALTLRDVELTRGSV